MGCGTSSTSENYLTGIRLYNEYFDTGASNDKLLNKARKYLAPFAKMNHINACFILGCIYEITYKKEGNGEYALTADYYEHVRRADYYLLKAVLMGHMDASLRMIPRLEKLFKSSPNIRNDEFWQRYKPQIQKIINHDSEYLQICKENTSRIPLNPFFKISE